MADLVTHLCSALLPGAFLRGRALGAVVFGTVLPDLISRVPPLALELTERIGVLRVPDALLLPWGIFHEPVALVPACTLLALAFARHDRWLALTGLLGGCALHLGLDLLQDHHGNGYFLLAPCSLERYELGLIGSEATVHIAVPLALVTFVTWSTVGKQRRQSISQAGDEDRRRPPLDT